MRDIAAGFITERLAVLDACVVSDALDHLGVSGAVTGVRRPCWTPRSGWRTNSSGWWRRSGALGTATVSDALDRLGLPGTAIWGVCRDTVTALAQRYPLFTCGRFMRTGKDRVEVADVQAPVALGDVQARPGDIVVGDDDGVVVVPAHRLPEVLDLAEAIGATEDDIARAVLGGATISAARREFGYHTLHRNTVES